MSSSVPPLPFNLLGCILNLDEALTYSWKSSFSGEQEEGERDQPPLKVGMTLIQALGCSPGQLICGQATLHQFCAALIKIT